MPNVTLFLLLFLSASCSSTQEHTVHSAPSLSLSLSLSLSHSLFVSLYLPPLLSYIFLCEVDEVLEVDVVAVGSDVVVDEEVQLVFDPVLKDEGQHSRRQLQAEDDLQKHSELHRENTCY